MAWFHKSCHHWPGSTAKECWSAKRYTTRLRWWRKQRREVKSGRRQQKSTAAYLSRFACVLLVGWSCVVSSRRCLFYGPAGRRDGSLGEQHEWLSQVIPRGEATLSALSPLLKWDLRSDRYSLLRAWTQCERTREINTSRTISSYSASRYLNLNPEGLKNPSSSKLQIP